MMVCVGCDSPNGEPHQDWCPVMTGTLSSLSRRPAFDPDSPDFNGGHDDDV